jgi:hypothetical protein
MLTNLSCPQDGGSLAFVVSAAFIGNILYGDSEINSKTKLHGLSPRVNYTDRATAACRRSDCFLRIEGATWSA